MKKLLFISFVAVLMGTSCKGQDRIDLSTIDFNVFNLPVEEKPLIDEFSIYPPSTISYQYQYENMDAFCFGNFKLENRGEPRNTLYVYLNEKKDHIRSISLSIHDNKDSENFVSYLITNYGKPKVLKPEPTRMENGKPFGNAAYLWKDILPNRSIVLFKNYGTSNGKWSYGISVDYVPTESSERFNVYDNKVNALEYLVLMNSYEARVALGKSIDDLKAFIKNKE